MGNEQSIRDLLIDRDAEYGLSWLTTGQLLQTLPLDKVVKTGFFFNWLMILNKAIRILHSPLKPDHWRDIAGYAILVHDRLENANAAGSRPVLAHPPAPERSDV